MSAALDGLLAARRFIIGFQGDELQEGIDDLLAKIQAGIIAEYKALGMHFRLFQASRKYTKNVYETMKVDVDGSICHGFIYDTEKTASYIEQRDGKFYLSIGANEWVSDDLEYLEKILWACHVLWEEPKELEDENLDFFIQGWCAAYNIKIDGDLFAAGLTRLEPWMPEDARNQIQTLADVHGLRNNGEGLQ